MDDSVPGGELVSPFESNSVRSHTKRAPSQARRAPSCTRRARSWTKNDLFAANRARVIVLGARSQASDASLVDDRRTDTTQHSPGSEGVKDRRAALGGSPDSPSSSATSPARTRFQSGNPAVDAWRTRHSIPFEAGTALPSGAYSARSRLSGAHARRPGRSRVTVDALRRDTVARLHMATMYWDGALKVRGGLTSCDELMRHVRRDDFETTPRWLSVRDGWT